MKLEKEKIENRKMLIKLEEYVNKIRPNLKIIINDLKKSIEKIYDAKKIQLKLAKLISLKDTDEERVMHSKSDNIEFIIYYFLSHFLIDIKFDWKYQFDILSLIKFTSCITNVRR